MPRIQLSLAFESDLVFFYLEHNFLFLKIQYKHCYRAKGTYQKDHTLFLDSRDRTPSHEMSQRPVKQTKDFSKQFTALTKK